MASKKYHATMLLISTILQLFSNSRAMNAFSFFLSLHSMVIFSLAPCLFYDFTKVDILSLC